MHAACQWIHLKSFFWRFCYDTIQHLDECRLYQANVWSNISHVLIIVHHVIIILEWCWGNLFDTSNCTLGSNHRLSPFPFNIRRLRDTNLVYLSLTRPTRPCMLYSVHWSDNYPVNSLYSRHCMSSVARVRNSGSLFQSIMSVIYFCPEFICCPYYRGVR